MYSLGYNYSYAYECLSCGYKYEESVLEKRTGDADCDKCVSRMNLIRFWGIPEGNIFKDGYRIYRNK